MLPQNTDGQVCTSGKGYLWFAWLKLIPHCKVSTVNFDVGGEYCMNARMQTRHYKFLHLKFKNRSICLLCVWLIWRRISNLSKCNASDWAGWLPLAAFTVTWTAVRLENARLWPISQNIKEQKARTMILKARIVNKRDNFIHVLKISTTCSEIRKRIADSSRLESDFTTTWIICCMLWDDQICHRAMRASI